MYSSPGPKMALGTFVTGFREESARAVPSLIVSFSLWTGSSFTRFPPIYWTAAAQNIKNEINAFQSPQKKFWSTWNFKACWLYYNTVAVDMLQELWFQRCLEKNATENISRLDNQLLHKCVLTVTKGTLWMLYKWHDIWNRQGKTTLIFVTVDCMHSKTRLS